MKDDEDPANPTDPIRIGQGEKRNNLSEETIFFRPSKCNKKAFGFCFENLLPYCIIILFYFSFLFFGGVGKSSFKKIYVGVEYTLR